MYGITFKACMTDRAENAESVIQMRSWFQCPGVAPTTQTTVVCVKRASDTSLFSCFRKLVKGLDHTNSWYFATKRYNDPTAPIYRSIRRCFNLDGRHRLSDWTRQGVMIKRSYLSLLCTNETPYIQDDPWLGLTRGDDSGNVINLNRNIDRPGEISTERLSYTVGE